MAGFKSMIAPVRPSHFYEHSQLSIENYVDLRRADGLLADPWLRAHECSGAEKLTICSQSAVVMASISKWSEWTGMSSPQTGNYALDRGLAPLKIDLKKNDWHLHRTKCLVSIFALI